jgi:hypothetical protein
MLELGPLFGVSPGGALAQPLARLGHGKSQSGDLFRAELARLAVFDRPLTMSSASDSRSSSFKRSAARASCRTPRRRAPNFAGMAAEPRQRPGD